MLNVYIAPPAHLSRAMFRVARALARYAPDSVKIVTDQNQADFHVLHVIGFDAISYVSMRPDLNYAVVQYCLKAVQAPNGNNMMVDGDWAPLWDRAKTVWSYYDLGHVAGGNFYRAPLGIDIAFTQDVASRSKNIGAMTSGYVSGQGAEAIEEVAEAASQLGLSVVHLGPDPVGMDRPRGDWRTVHNISDHQLATFYRSTGWVSGLRYIEGFELPVIEGLACGARPIVFDRPEMRYWYDGHAVFVPECEGEELVKHLVDVMSNEPTPVSDVERADVLQRFDWKPIVQGFWERVL